jgi:hypothetical protein
MNMGPCYLLHTSAGNLAKANCLGGERGLYGTVKGTVTHRGEECDCTVKGTVSAGEEEHDYIAVEGTASATMTGIR